MERHCTTVPSGMRLLPTSVLLAFTTTSERPIVPANYTSLDRGLLLQILRFGLVGGLATITHIAVATVLLYVFPSLHPVAANIAAFLLAFLVSFVGHSRFTFRRDGNLPRFLVAAIAGLCASNAVLVALLAIGASAIPSLWMATLAAPLVVYVISKLWVFKAHA